MSVVRLKCYQHPEVEAVGICTECGKGVCSSCAVEKGDKKITCTACDARNDPEVRHIDPSMVEIIEPRKGFNRDVFRNGHPAMDYALLGCAIFLDVVDVLPLPLDSIGVGFLLELPLSAMEGAFLMSLGVPPVKSVGQAAVDMIPIINIIPWCTMAVLDKKFNFRGPWLTRLFNR
jgi:hypothetical protein